MGKRRRSVIVIYFVQSPLQELRQLCSIPGNSHTRTLPFMARFEAFRSFESG